jgi:alpha-N-arabinofuranosidase
VPYLDVSAVHDKARETVTFFIVNRHGTEALDLDVSLLEFGALKIIDDQVIAMPDLTITNTAEKPDNVVPEGWVRRLRMESSARKSHRCLTG